MGEFCQGKSSPNFYFKKYIKNVTKRNLVKSYMVCLFNKFVRFFLEQVPYIFWSSIILGAIVRGANFPGGIYPVGNCQGGKVSGGQLAGRQLAGGQLSCPCAGVFFYFKILQKIFRVPILKNIFKWLLLKMFIKLRKVKNCL